MRIRGTSGIVFGGVLILAGLLLASPIVAWLAKLLGYLLIGLGIGVVIMGLVGRSRRSSGGY